MPVIKGANTKSVSTLRTTKNHGWDPRVICDKGCLLNFFMRNLLRGIHHDGDTVTICNNTLVGDCAIIWRVVRRFSSRYVWYNFRP